MSEEPESYLHVEQSGYSAPRPGGACETEPIDSLARACAERDEARRQWGYWLSRATKAEIEVGRLQQVRYAARDAVEYLAPLTPAWILLTTALRLAALEETSPQREPDPDPVRSEHSDEVRTLGVEGDTVRLVHGCSACSKDHPIYFVRLAKPDGEWTHVGVCPNTGTAVRMRFEEVTGDAAK